MSLLHISGHTTNPDVTAGGVVHKDRNVRMSVGVHLRGCQLYLLCAAENFLKKGRLRLEDQFDEGLSLLTIVRG